MANYTRKTHEVHVLLQAIELIVLSGSLDP